MLLFLLITRVRQLVMLAALRGLGKGQFPCGVWRAQVLARPPESSQEPQRPQRCADGSESQGEGHAASGSSGPSPSRPVTGDPAWEGAGSWGLSFSSRPLSGTCLLLPSYMEMATLSSNRSLSQEARPSEIGLLCLLQDSCPYGSASHVIFLYSLI